MTRDIETHQAYVTEGKNVSQRAKPASVTSSVPENSNENVIEEDEDEIKARIAKAKGETAHKKKMLAHAIWSVELKAIQAQKEALAEEVAKSSTTISAPKIGRPRRGVGIQEGMGLSDDKHKYDAIRVCPHMGLAIGM